MANFAEVVACPPMSRSTVELLGVKSPNVPLIVVLSERVIEEEPESITTFPVVEFPRVNVWALVVPNTPRPVRVVALLPELAEILAVGVPLLTFRKANLEEAVEELPIKTSSVSLTGDKPPDNILHKDAPPPELVIVV